MRRHTFKRYFFVFRKMFLRTYHPSFTATNISDIGSSLQIFSVMTAFTSIISLLFVDSLVRTKEASFWIAFLESLLLAFVFLFISLEKKSQTLPKTYLRNHKSCPHWSDFTLYSNDGV